ncbi:MAG: excinuclease ABC subunit UvrA [Verrucomicrobia bacterium]|nr:excinuclease ABC subunit UvrA [Verrucomicrobiota bacterium]
MDSIRLRGARQNNLQSIDLELPLGKLIVVTGPSGSGKSSLAFDTIYAEGQRRYVETFSPYTRQFLERMDKPLADSIEGIPPAIAIEQANNVRTTRSTVGTITEVNDYLKLLLPRAAKAFCPGCGGEIVPGTPRSILRSLFAAHAGKTLLIAFPIKVPEKTKPADFFEFLAGQGYLRVWLEGKTHRTDEPPSLKKLPTEILVIQDRIDLDSSATPRLTESLETALRLGNDRLAAIDPATGRIETHTSGWHCAPCSIDIRPPSPGLFSFNSPLGACPECKGFGRIIGIDMQRAIPDRSLSISEGVIRPFQSGQSAECQDDLLRHCRKRGIEIHRSFERLPKPDQDFVIHGEPGLEPGEAWESGAWYGVDGYFRWLEGKAYKMHIRVLLSRYRSYQPCPKCRGGRFQPETLNYKIAGLTLPELAALPLHRLLPILEGLQIPHADSSAKLVHRQIASRTAYLCRIGLGYLSLDRPTRSLSGGELQRVNLTTCLGASLVNTLFVLDEPSVGLHPRDTSRLIETMQGLRDKGNTLLVVEHEEAVIRAADELVDIGPGRGRSGGQLLYCGPAGNFASAKNSLTADYLTGKKSIPVPKKRRKPAGHIALKGVTHHNLKNLSAKFPLGVLCAVTGVSGSGKTSLVRDVLHRQLVGGDAPEEEAAGFVKSLSGDDEVDEVVMVDQSPLAKTPRSTPAVYLGVYDHIRELFGDTPAAEAAGFTPSSFSFNSGNGRCDRCSGLGFEKVEMQFLSDLFLRCPECEGTRFRAPLLKIQVAGKSIHEVLELTASEAVEFFAPLDPAGKITGPLKLLAEVGLDYLKLGQPVNSLSGGESQRLKLVHHLVRQSRERALLIFDEPTTGLHFDDVALLVKVFHRLVDQGNSVIVIEHNLEVVKCADWIIDLGPEGGDEGGKIVAEGTPEKILSVPASHTARFLAPLLEGPAPSGPSPLLNESPLPKNPPPAKTISVRGAREHNLKNIDIDIPRDGMVVVTGLSGSGKSTLAFDILFAEGQRRFLDSMSAYARQFVDQLEKPDVDSIEGLPPSVAIEQRVTRGGGKSTVATVTEIYHFLRLLFSKLGTQFCPECDVAVASRTPTAIAEEVNARAAKGPVKILANLVKGRKGFHTEIARAAARQGIETLIVDGSRVAVDAFQKLERFKEHTIDAIVGELDAPDLKKADDLVRKALRLGKGTARLVDAKGKSTTLSTEMNCPSCQRAFEPLDPRLFSFNSPHGWCGHCRGFGEVWRGLGSGDGNFETAIEAELDEERRHEGLEDGEPRPCPICKGTRLNETATHVRIGKTSIADFTRSPAADALSLSGTLKFTGPAAEVARDILAEITQRLEFLAKVGLDYLSLDRSAKTLSGGESQRIRLAAQLGSNLRGVLYVLDEPTIGLHPRDNERLLDALQTLAKKGNSLVVVEHDEETMRRADRIIDLGPGAGSRGGRVVASGTLAEILGHPTSHTASALREPMKHPLRGKRRPAAKEWLELKGCRLHNIKNETLRIPLQRLTVLTGVSGSGKSTLVRGIAVPSIRDALARKRAPAHSDLHTGISGFENLAGVLEVDQSPIGKTSRSTPATYVKVFDEIRKLFANIPAARMRGYTASRFSFNNEGGRCEACLGQGVTKLEMNFLPPSYMPCQDCSGRRYNPSTLEILYNGKSIGDVMDMAIEQAVEFFAAHPKIRRPLSLLLETGLGYLKLGQPSPTLSGGEAQRIKLVTQLARRATSAAEEIRTTRKGKSILYVLEEPTIGLHAHDVAQLVQVLHRLVDEGGTVVVIEHHLDIMAEADHILDIGPEAGSRGGKIIAVGPPEKIAQSKTSHTAPFLKKILTP